MAHPTLTVLAESAGSRAFGSDDAGVSSLADHGYSQTEVLLTGVAADEHYAVRMLLRHPVDPRDASGVAVVEPMHFAGVRSVWPVVRKEVVRSGHVWVEVACQPSAVQILTRFDPARYSEVHLVDGAAAGAPAEASIGKDAAAGRTMEEVQRESEEFRRRWFTGAVQAPEILAQVASALRAGFTPADATSTVILSGLSQTGGFVRNFATAHHTRLSSSRAVFDGYLPMCSGGDALPDLDVPIIELLAESEMEELRIANILPGQTRAFTHRRPDSQRFRLYEVAGMSHVDSRDHDPRSAERLAGTQRWSRFPSTHVVGATLHSLVAWIEEGVAPAPGVVFERDRDGRLSRDVHGNVRGGWRTAHVDVPTSSISVISGPGESWVNGVEAPLSRERLTELYGSEQGYRQRVESRLRELVEQGYYLEADARDYSEQASW